MSAATDNHFTFHSANILREQMKVINQVLRKRRNVDWKKEKIILPIFVK